MQSSLPSGYELKPYLDNNEMYKNHFMDEQVFKEGDFCPLNQKKDINQSGGKSSTNIKLISPSEGVVERAKAEVKQDKKSVKDFEKLYKELRQSIGLSKRKKKTNCTSQVGRGKKQSSSKKRKPKKKAKTKKKKGVRSTTSRARNQTRKSKQKSKSKSKSKSKRRS